MHGVLASVLGVGLALGAIAVTLWLISQATRIGEGLVDNGEGFGGWEEGEGIGRLRPSGRVTNARSGCAKRRIPARTRRRDMRVAG